MTPERWQQIDQLFHAALACEPGALVKINKFDWAGAEKELKLARELDPNSDFVNGAYWSYLTSIGRVYEALQFQFRNAMADTGVTGEANNRPMILRFGAGI